MPRTYTRRPLIDRVMDRVVEVDGHWIWTGGVGSSGYGQIRDGGHAGQARSVHRTVWEHFLGPIPTGLVLDHLGTCLQIRCCNPDHLEPVTQRENRRRQAERVIQCKNGHDYTPENTRAYQGHRECRRCHADREREARRRRRAAKQAAYVDVCARGHRRTPENTWARETGPTCRDCMSDSARNRRHRGVALLSGSGNPQSLTAE